MDNLDFMTKLHVIEHELRILKQSYKRALDNDEEFEIVKAILTSIRQAEAEIYLMVSDKEFTYGRISSPARNAEA